MSSSLRVLCASTGHMGRSRALAHHAIPDFEICGIVTRSSVTHADLSLEFGENYGEFSNYEEALVQTAPDTEGSICKSKEANRLEEEPGHDALCPHEQLCFLKAILEGPDLDHHMEDALSAMRIRAAADEGFRTGKTIELQQ